MSRSSSPINLNQYRKINWQHRLLAVGAYVGVTLFYFPPLNHELMFQLGLYLAVWIICFNPKVKTPAFVRFHLIQGVIALIILQLVPTIFQILLGLIASILAFMPALAGTSLINQVLFYIFAATALLMLGLAIFNSIMALLGKQHELPFIGKIATSYTYNHRL
jgi:uncharacterized membrane protein